MVCVVVLLHLPAIVLIWPRIVWRRNFLFGLIPAGLGLIATFIFALGGVETEITSIHIPIEGAEPPAQLPMETSSTSDPRPTALPVSIGLGVFSIVLLLAMQQRSQRRTAIIAVLLGAGTVETVYQIKEAMFREDQQKIHAYLEATLREKGSYPTREDFDPIGLELATPRVTFVTHGSAPAVFRVRPLSMGYSIVSESNGESIRIQD